MGGTDAWGTDARAYTTLTTHPYPRSGPRGTCTGCAIRDERAPRVALGVVAAERCPAWPGRTGHVSVSLLRAAGVPGRGPGYRAMIF